MAEVKRRIERSISAIKGEVTRKLAAGDEKSGIHTATLAAYLSHGERLSFTLVKHI